MDSLFEPKMRLTAIVEVQSVKMVRYIEIHSPIEMVVGPTF